MIISLMEKFTRKNKTIVARTAIGYAENIAIFGAPRALMQLAEESNLSIWADETLLIL